MKIISILKQKPVLLLLVIIGILLFGLGASVFLFPQNSTSPANSTPDSQSNESDTEINKIDGMKLYRNEEWGFEFWYPENWVVKENIFGSYYSKFNLVINPELVRSSNFTILVNIVLPEFAESSFQDIKTTSEVAIGGVQGIKYQYEFEGKQETTIVLPLGEYRMILGIDEEQYANISNQFLATFKFLK